VHGVWAVIALRGASTSTSTSNLCVPQGISEAGGHRSNELPGVFLQGITGVREGEGKAHFVYGTAVTTP